MGSSQHTTYDAVAVLGGGYRKDGNRFLPSSYAQSDHFGMLGGELRVRAALDVYAAHQADTFVFSTGVGQKQIDIFGPGIPTEAFVYAEYFKELLHGTSLPIPRIILEDVSTNTITNLIHILGLAKRHHWRTLLLISSEFHIPRITALFELVQERQAHRLNVTYKSAEDIVRAAQPGVYDAEIEAAYASPEGQKRLAIEKQGLEDLKSGRYVETEFHLHPRSKK